MSTLAAVRLWGRTVGAVELGDGQQVATFEYAPAFLRSGVELSPLQMPLRARPYRFPALPRDTFHGLPGLLADALPDRFGNALIDAWLAGRGREPRSFNAVERLCYTGRRGMGALEFEPVEGFNLVARNQDDHVKNISFLMNQSGTWSLSPAYDVTYSYEPRGAWTAQHQMSVNGRYADFARADLRAAEDVAGVRRGFADRVLDETVEVVSRWPAFADEARVAPEDVERIARTHRLAWPRTTG